MVRTINGKPRPFGDDKPKKGAAIAAAAVVTGGALAVGGASIGIGGGTTASLDSAASQALKSKSSSKKSAQKGRHSEAWQRLGWRRIKKQAKRELECGPHSFGEVQRFFLRRPCVDLDRMLVTVNDGAGNTIDVSVAWVKMPAASQASDLKRLIDKDGTGNVLLFGEAPPGSRFTGKNYDSRLAKKVLVVAESAPAGGRPSETTLETAVEVAVEFPSP
ncbi:hypothetical protein BS330_14330 [Amycolatopsis keratiniphila subsp. nogabecina]|uniref:hypothetical protein n=1 Tax=Amycolatopsis keratiniphila TaxID=129921 RepID=UPI00087C8B56|nr:hypothetical protein [Amycolatopsis keratiniphila]OLZ57937.1 hypothetical protein BS330_14330 [Amycolatopsis keratiniphila subsp. nogabecina]SDU04532.1 hypothetical protein SAMN04489733_0671 [Amycolatopsis keratiniphila]